MAKLKLPNITLIGIDCIDVERLLYAINASESGIEFGTVKILTSLPANDPRKIEIPHIGTIDEYCHFCIEDLHKYVDTDYALLVQYDGFVLNPESWTDEFLKYDYIGAPWFVENWLVEKFDFPTEMVAKMIVGNGGFSLRSKKFLETSSKLFQQGKIHKINPEDIAMCVWYRDEFEKEGIKFAPTELAQKFSIESKTDNYGEPFGFHGAYGKNIDSLIAKYPPFPTYIFLYRVIKKRIEQIIKVFQDIAIESHLLGSFARGEANHFSDLDIWLTFKDEDFETFKSKRMEYFAKVGDIVRVIEPHQNAPIGGLFSSVLYKTKVGLFIIDYYLCPQSTAFVTDESKNLFGNDIALPTGQLGLNPKKVEVTKEYRIDFAIGFLFGAIKKLARKNENPLGQLLQEYNYLRDKYDIPVKEVGVSEHDFIQLLELCENMKEVANNEQKKVIIEIENFAKLVKDNL